MWGKEGRMTAERPWMKFYPQDWRADERLRNCSLAARGLWLELIALMHRSERYGYLLINGKAPSDRALAIQAGAAIDEVKEALAELEAEGVFSRDLDGLIFSRRMVRDEEKHRKASNFGKRGVRAKARKEKEDQPPLEGSREGSLKPSHKGGHEGTHQLRDQSPDNPPVSPKVKGQKIPIPDDFDPAEFGEGTQCRAIVQGWSQLEFERQLERFRAHHQKEASKFADWQAAWRTWVLNSPGFSEPRRPRAQGQPAGDDFASIVLAEAAQRGKK
jgi:DNA-binding transcriptional regulator YhcF (GntR family)